MSFDTINIRPFSWIDFHSFQIIHFLHIISIISSFSSCLYFILLFLLLSQLFKKLERVIRNSNNASSQFILISNFLLSHFFFPLLYPVVFNLCCEFPVTFSCFLSGLFKFHLILFKLFLQKRVSLKVFLRLYHIPKHGISEETLCLVSKAEHI